MNNNFFNNFPNKPKEVSLWKLVQYNYISENDINQNGKVDTIIYNRALREYTAELGTSTIFTRNKSYNINLPKNILSINNKNKLIEHSLNDNNNDQEPNVCCMCLTNNISHIFIPCYHICSCNNCAYKVDRCPKCRTKIQNIHRVWF